MDTMQACPKCGNAVSDRIALTATGHTVCLDCGYIHVPPVPVLVGPAIHGRRGDWE